ncbi:hypothetical protein Tco_0695732 [Tanacetum coccineum]
MNRIHSNKSNETHNTHQQLYDTLYKSTTLDQDALDAQAAQSSFHKRSHDNQDAPNNREGENKKKRRNNVGEPSSRSSRRNRSSVVIVQDDTPTMQPLDQADILIQKHSKPKRFPKKSGPSTIAIAKKFKELIQKDELTIVDLEGAGLERIKVQYNIDVELEYHVSQLKATVLSKAQWNIDEGDVSKPISFEQHMLKKQRSSALNGIHHWEEGRIDFFKAGMSVVTEGNVYSDLRIKSVVNIVIKKKWGYGFLTSIVVRRSDDKEYEFRYADLPRLNLNNFEDMYLLQVQDKLHHLPLEFMKDFNNALLLFIRRVVIQNRVEDIQLGVERVVYLNQHNVKSFMKLSEVKKFYDGTLIKIHETLVDMVKKNKLGTGNKQLKGRDWTDMDVEKSNEMVNKIDKILKRREQLRRLEEYVGGRPKTVNPWRRASTRRSQCPPSLDTRHTTIFTITTAPQSPPSTNAITSDACHNLPTISRASPPHLRHRHVPPSSPPHHHLHSTVAAPSAATTY